MMLSQQQCIHARPVQLKKACCAAAQQAPRNVESDAAKWLQERHRSGDHDPRWAASSATSLLIGVHGMQADMSGKFAAWQDDITTSHVRLLRAQ